MQLTEAALPGAVSSLRVLSCSLGANGASSVDRQWHEPRCLPRVSDTTVSIGLRAWEQSVDVEQAFWRGMLCSITIFLFQGSKWQGGCGDLLPACQSLVVCLPVGCGVGHPGKVLQVCNVLLVSLSADIWAPLAPQRTQFIPPHLLLLKIKIF